MFDAMASAQVELQLKTRHAMLDSTHGKRSHRMRHAGQTHLLQQDRK